MYRRWAFVIALVLLVATACGGDDSTESDRPNIEDDATPTVVGVGSATVDPIPTPTAVPAEIEPERLTYTVQQGDLLGDIARTFGVPLGAVISVNEITDPNVIGVGQEIIIPNEEEIAEWEAAQAAAEPAADAESDADAADS